MDYHIALRIDSGLLAMQMLYKLTRLVMCLDGNYRTYQKGMMMQLLILLYQQKHDLPTWKMFTRSVSVFNEEAGEMSFSVLSRVVLGDNLKMKFDHMDKMYKLTRAYSEASEALRVEQDRKERKHGYHLLTDKQVRSSRCPFSCLRQSVASGTTCSHSIPARSNARTQPTPSQPGGLRRTPPRPSCGAGSSGWICSPL